MYVIQVNKMEKYKFVRDSSIRIPASLKKELWFKLLVKTLTRKSKAYEGAPGGDVDIKKYYDVNKEDKELLVPRFIHLQGCDYELIDNIPDGEDIYIKSKVVPRNDRQKEAMDWFIENDNGVLCLSPGEGKTVISIASICSIGKKAIIFVHKDSLVDQWRERFLEHSEVREDQIARLRTSSVEKDLTKPIIVTTVQTFCSIVKNVPNSRQLITDANIGVGIWDECHTSVSAEQFSKTSLNLPCRRVYGLSATPKRSDGNSDIIGLHLGPVFIPQSSGIDTMDPKIIMLKFDHKVMCKHYNYIMHRTKYDSDNKIKPFFDTSRYLSQLIKSKVYIKNIQRIVRQISKSDRHLLFIADRIKILDAAAKGCVDQNEVGFFIPRSGKERDAHLARRLVFSTPGSSRDGTDKKELDCLILATAVGNIEQAAGRVVRTSKGKQQPVILDLVDTGDDRLISRSYSRLKFYNQKKWTVEERILD